MKRWVEAALMAENEYEFAVRLGAEKLASVERTWAGEAWERAYDAWREGLGIGESLFEPYGLEMAEVCS